MSLPSARSPILGFPFRGTSIAVGASAVAIGMVVLVGDWWGEVEIVKRVAPGLATMKPNTALSSSWLALNGYLFGADMLYRITAYGTMALHTAATCLVLNLGVFVTRPLCWPTRLVLARDVGGTVSRWLISAAVIAPPTFGWILQHQALLPLDSGTFVWALHATLAAAGSVALVLLLAGRISTLNWERDAATLLSQHDALSGLANRRSFDASLIENFQLARRHGHALALLMLDIDNFKSCNDAFGHPAGDELLVARIGGEEFAIVLPETPAAGACVQAERIRASIERSTAFRRPMTVSIGVAVLHEATSDPASLVRECDARLYEAKQPGRNRIVCAE